MKIKQAKMRSIPVKQDPKLLKNPNKNPSVAKKKKLSSLSLNSPVRDTISETISFVIKGKLTPINPVLVHKKIDSIDKKKAAKGRKIDQKTAKIKKEVLKRKSKVQIKTAKNTSAQNICKKKPDKVVVNVVSPSPKGTSKSPNESKLAKNKPKAKEIKPKRIAKIATKDKAKCKSPQKAVKKQTNVKKPNKALIDEDEIKKQQTIEALLKEVNEEIKPRKSKLSKHKSGKSKKKKEQDEVKSEKPLDAVENVLTNQDVPPVVQKAVKSELIETETAPKAELTQPEPAEDTAEIKKEPFSSEEKDEPQEQAVKKKYRKIKTKSNVTVMKKRVPSKGKNKEDTVCKTKLFKFWNGPKRHRVASLNALAKVHCLYENETRGNMLDMIDELSKLPYSAKKDSLKSKIKDEDDDEDDEEEEENNSDESPPPTRVLRSAPGLRGVGKHWEMHETSSSDEDDVAAVKHKPPKPKTAPSKPKQPKEETAEKKQRKPNEPVMDLKDMVVSKRMASLNASAILAASYSAEKRPDKCDSDSSSSAGNSSEEEYFARLAKDIKEEIDEKKDDDAKLIEVRAAPNKKVAVILNQDTDVTITGVYVNSTTRSTHHEGYCSIAGMQYRISATSHTQTAATAVASETLLQSSSSGPDNSNSDSMPSSKSYTPLDALSNMQPPPGPGIQHGHPVQHMGPPQHVLPLPPHQLSPGLRHGCSSAFSSPNSNPAYHHPPLPGEPGFVHAGYYQPAGPLISVPPPHAHGQPPPPPVPPLTKSIPLSDASPASSTTPSLAHEVPPPPPSSNGDSSDSEVIITSVTTAKDNIPTQVHAAPSYRYPPQYTSYQYPYPHPYSYPAVHPPPNPPYSHHDLCYSAGPYGHKWNFRRHLAGTQYYPVPNPPEIYSVSPAGPSQQSQQMVAAPPTSASGSFTSPPGPPPPPTIMETYAGQLESYQPPPPPPHFYPSPPYPPPGSCYTHQPTRTIPYINTYQSSCPCPMQSCPKNVLTGPLTGDSKRSNITSISNESMPLASIALVLPSEPASATGPPSPARGSAGMPPPPSPAGATYQPPPAPTKREARSPVSEADCKLEKKRKARIGKAMVRNNIAANMQQNTMLLMCNPPQDYVKREIESPKETDLDQKSEEAKPLQASCKESEISDVNTQLPVSTEPKEEKTICQQQPLKEEIEESLPIISTVAENVKVKNMKRKLSICPDKPPDLEVPTKKQKTGSYKFLIKRETSTVRINNGKRKLLGDMSSPTGVKIKLRKPLSRRALRLKREASHRKSSNRRRSRAYKAKLKNPASRRAGAKPGEMAPAALDKLFAKNNVERIIESVISDTVRTKQAARSAACAKRARKNVREKATADAKTAVAARRKSKSCEAVATPVPKPVKPKWSNGWMWEGEPFEAKVFLNSDEMTVVRKCYPAMIHQGGDKIVPRDCVLLKAGPRKNDLPFVAKIASLWENPDDGEMMMSLLWYYRPEHTEQGRLPTDQTDEVFASRHKDSNSVACIDDKCYVLTFNEYCRYRKTTKRMEAGIEEALPCIPNPEPYPRSHRQPPMTQISPEMVFFCRRVYDFRQKRIMKNPT
ncbi:unnamed protein product [Phyllotreta striolata]|uniref:BAH domain-containing protein n=1 Tax=Phyllotreta striolata TaxID=444603 RepID=A0A9P0GUY1_PHYSR|nr:unnamed protein product [Phyllotreta striolata]